MTPALILDGLVAALLLATVIYCFILNRRLSVMRDAQSEMSTLISEFNKAIEQARSGVETLKETAADAGDKLGREVDKARAMADELLLMTDSGERLAERLEGGIGQVRGTRPATAGSGSDAGGQQTGKDRWRSDAERELFQALRQTR